MAGDTQQPGWRAALVPDLPRIALLATVAAAIALRLLFVFRYSALTPDSILYADIAKNWLQHGVFGVTADGGITPTYIRLPGYPAFLAGIFAVAGVDHFNAVRLVQAAVDVATCFVVHDLARRVASRRAAAIAFLLYALCPFVANYVAAPLTETLAIFFAAVALDCASAALDAPFFPLRAWIGCGVAIALGLLLRPDGGIVLLAVGASLAVRAASRGAWRRMIAGGLVLAAVSLAPLAPWAWRNWRVFHRFEPLVPVTATLPTEFSPQGFDRWQRTWIVDYASVVDVGFQVSGDPIDLALVPARAFGPPAERERTVALLNGYNEQLAMTPELDAGFAALAAARIGRAPFRYYVLLPALRALDLWFRPRTELLPVDAHFWDIEQGWDDVTVSWAFALLNFLYVGAAIAAIFVARVRHVALLAGFCLLRTVVVTVVQFPEPRYVLECFPAVVVLAGAAVDEWKLRRARAH